MSQRTIPRSLVLLLAFAAGATAANLYYSQPLLARIAAELHASPAAVSIIPTLTQLGYAIGLLALVPIGDMVERRGLIVLLTALVVVGLLFVAGAPTLPFLIIANFVVGLLTVAPQLIMPLTAHLASDERERGRVLGTVMSGLLVGIILSRTVSGAAAGLVGWRMTYVVAAAVMALLALVLRFALPAVPAEHALRYGELFRSMGTLIRTEPLLRRHALVGAFGFASFSGFWTALAFHLARLSPRYGPATVGAFGIIGVSGAIAAPFAGRFAVRMTARTFNGIALAVCVTAWLVMLLGGHSLVVLALGVILLDAGAQASHISNQTRIFALGAAIRNRLNAVYMVTYFTGGALGSLLAGSIWERFGWSGVCAGGALFAAAALAVLFSGQPDDAPAS